MRAAWLTALAAALGLAACSPAQPGYDLDKASPGAVDQARLLAATGDGDNWLAFGRTPDEQRFSPLDQVNNETVKNLGLAWSADMDTARGQEATPLVVDGVLYVSTAWSMVKAYDAASGKPIWSYDPEVPRDTLARVCCDAVNRGVAVYNNKVFVAALDGRLIALDAATGKPVWSKVVVPDQKSYAITGAPRVVKGRIILGNAGSEYKARGSIAAFDPETGDEVWRFHTVPGDPAKGFENPAMEKAAKTWTGKWWELGGGGTVWDSISYDPALNLIYFGTGNAEPWNPAPMERTGDNLYTSSIVAVNADTGEYVWHFQETPEDRWDFDSNQSIILADLPINGTPRRVVLHAPKNGFFYVLDAKTGAFLSGKPFTAVNWASGLDPKTGYPVINPEARYEKTGKPFISVPGAAGAHSWQSMAFSPKTGLVYIPVQEAGFPYAAQKDWQPSAIGFQTGLDNAAVAMPADAKVQAGAKQATTGSLLAWDPVAQKPAWSVKYPGPWNGGALATAGNLLFQGTAGGEFIAYSADKGAKLWSFPTQSGVIAAPMTYRVKGEQYVAILVGWGGVWDVATGVLAGKSGTTRNISRLLVFKIGGKGALPPAPPLAAVPLDPPPSTGTAAQIAAGGQTYGRYCSACHGDAAVAGGVNPDLRHSGALNDGAAFKSIVIEGALQHQGMVSFRAALKPDDAEAVRHYVISRANEDLRLEK
ncbi:PQQ-dependent dehydrogenase, methanol/ethanol family [Novosphingobium sp.]|uniref:PQQ-dependent dehydrogenase, methanol/ethanol family n=1 Tax=Novosphingobium sp. TaxID=1874826 RepID=UPI0025DEB317|nr:PQQ-dependent dehydrogenase, methanol/ethanol family [Novosphingobium sp.]